MSPKDENSIDAKIWQLASQRSETGEWLFGRKGILKQVPGVSEWRVRKVINEVRGEGKSGSKAPTPEQRTVIQREAEQVSLPQIVIHVPPFKMRKDSPSKLKHWVIASDFHAPYQHEPSCNILYQVVEDLQPEKVILLGDVLNLDMFSRYPGEGKHPGSPTWIDEIAIAGTIMAQIKSCAPKAKLELFEGNHEMRLKKHLMRNDPVLYSHLDIEELFVLSDNPKAINAMKFFTYIDKAEVFDEELGIIFKHGTKVRKHAGMSAQAEVDDLLFSVVMGHCHRLGLYRRSSGRSRYMNQQPLFGMETGCMCRYDIPYVGGTTSNWHHGFGILTIDNSGNGPLIDPEIVSINNGKALYRGKLYSA